MAQPRTLRSMKSARASTAGLGVRMPWTVPGSPRAFSLLQKYPQGLLEHLVQCSQTVRAVGKIGPQNAHEAACSCAGLARLETGGEIGQQHGETTSDQAAKEILLSEDRPGHSSCLPRRRGGRGSQKLKYR